MSSRWTYFCAMMVAWNSMFIAEATFCVSWARKGVPPTSFSFFSFFSFSVTVSRSTGLFSEQSSSMAR